MEEVTKHIGPLVEEARKSREWQLGFWSNGSGRPLGFFQMRMKEDDERNRQIKEDLAKATSVAERLDDYVKAQMTLKEDREKRWNRWKPILKWGLTTIGGGLIGLCSWLGPKLIKAADIIWKDYQHYHPGLTKSLKDVGTTEDSVYAKGKNQPSDAGLPYTLPK